MSEVVNRKYLPVCYTFLCYTAFHKGLVSTGTKFAPMVCISNSLR